MVDDVIIASTCRTGRWRHTVRRSIRPFTAFTASSWRRADAPKNPKILYYEPKHVVGAGFGQYMIIASTAWPRVTYADEPLPLPTPRDLKRGDVVEALPSEGLLKCYTRAGYTSLLKDAAKRRAQGGP